MKFLLNSLLLALSVSLANGMNAGCDDKPNDGGFICQNCLKCTGYKLNGDGTKEVTISGEDCKDSGTISWMCCMEAGCNVADPGGHNKNSGDSNFLTILNLDASATTAPVQLHDGKAYGDDPVDSTCGNNTPKSNQGAGVPGGACSNVCNVDVDLTSETCTEGDTDPEIKADPHLKSWKGEWFDYMGECDLKLWNAPQFDGKLDMDVHIRTTIEFDYSFIEAAAIRIGDDILEVAGHGDYALNGVEGALEDDETFMKIGGYPIEYKQVSKKKYVYTIQLDEEEQVIISSFKTWVNVKIHGGSYEKFGQVTGLMGSYGGKMMDRSGVATEDMEVLGQSWQVTPDEDNLFRFVRAPQYPQMCRLPTRDHEKVARRRLGENIAEEAAELACAGFNGNAFAFCVHDVMATGDLEMAQAGAY